MNHWRDNPYRRQQSRVPNTASGRETALDTLTRLRRELSGLMGPLDGQAVYACRFRKKRQRR